MPAKKKRYSLKSKSHRRRIFEKARIFLAVVALSWGIWKLMDEFLWPGNPALAGGVTVIAAFLLLFLDDFHLKELE